MLKSKSRQWQSGTALVVVLGIVTSAITPFVLSTSAVANSSPDRVSQLFPQQRRSQTAGTRIPAGTAIPVKYEKAEKIIVTPDETSPLTLTVARNIRSTSGALLIPANSTIEGKLEPANGGSRFVAQDLVLTDGSRLPIEATSQVVTRKENVRRGANAGSILKGAAIGAAAAAALSEIFGDISLGKVLGGAGIGALGGVLIGRRSAEVVVIYPKTDLASLRLNSALSLR